MKNPNHEDSRERPATPFHRNTMSNPAPTAAIERRIDKDVAASTGLTPTGSMAFRSMNEIMEFAKVMAIANVAIPKHLRENPGACLAVAIQASEWQMSPFAVANKSYSVNDRIAYEAQLVNAVILRRAPIVGRFKIEYSGEGAARRCKVSAKLTDGDTVEYESPRIGDIPTKNSPLWKADPDQQLFYFSSRSMCRRHFPDVLLGIYTADEMAELEPIRNVTPRPEFAAAAPRIEQVAPFDDLSPVPSVEVEHSAQPAPEPTAQQPEEVPGHPPSNVIVGYFEKFTTQESKPDAKKPWKLWRVHYSVAGGAFREAVTFSASVGESIGWLTEGDKIEIEIEPGEKGDTIKSIGKVEGGAA